MAKQKKRTTNRKPLENDSHAVSPTAEKSCTHLKRNVDTNTLNKVLRKSTEFNCDECQKEGLKKDETGPIWACMQCGHKGCGRYSVHAHAVSHSEASRSSSHRIVLNLDTLAIWCYDCDDEVPRESCPSSIRSMLNTLHPFIKKSLELSMTKTEIVESEQLEETHKGTQKAKKVTKTENKLNLSQLPIKGLSNMGNTCFFNSVVQNLMQTNYLGEMLLDGSIEKGAKMNLTPKPVAEKVDDYSESSSDCNDQESDLHPITVTIETELGNLTHALRELYQIFDKNSATVITPRALFDEVCKKAHRFRSYEQQDSHELLRYLLDALRYEESIRRKTAILLHFGLKKNVDPKTVPGNVQKKLKAYDQAAEFTCVEQIFGGELLQCIKCLQCGHVSTRVESFLDLSLPVVENRRIVNTENFQHASSTAAVKSKYAIKKERMLARKQAKNSKRRKTEEIDLLDSTIEKMDSLDLDNENKNENNESAKNQKARTSEGGFEEMSHLDSEDALIDGTASNKNEVASDLDDNENENSGCNSAKIVNEDFSGDPSDDKWLHFTEPLDAVSRRSDTRVCHLIDCLAQFMSTETLCDRNKFGCENCTENLRSRKREADKEEKPSTVVYTDALKKYIIFSPPAVLTLHLKRFHQSGGGFMKINKYVEFPKILNLAPFCSKNSKRKPAPSGTKILYSLYGIVSHSGRLLGGHYVAYVKLREPKSRSFPEFLQNKFGGLKNVDKNNNNDNEETSKPPNFLEGTNTVVAVDSNKLDENDICSVVDESAKNYEDAGQWYCISDSHVSAVLEDKVMSSEAYLLFYERIF